LQAACYGTRVERVTGSGRKRLGVALRVIVTLGAVGYLLVTTDRHAVAAALRRASPAAFLAATGLVFGSVILGTLRWRSVLGAYGAREIPPTARLLRYYLVGLFYNTYLPGAVGGDVVRGMATRDAYPQAAAAFTVVLVERVLGLAALLLLAGTTALLWPPAGVGGVLPLALLGVGGALLALGLVAAGRRVGQAVGGRVGRWAMALPVLERPQKLLAAIVLSLGGHLFAAVGGHLTLRGLGVATTLGTSVVLVPLAVAAGFFPLTIAGAGAREGAFVALYRGVGVAQADAVAASFLLLAAQLIVAAVGGLITLFAPVATPAPDLVR
jgi:uncharacterized membrane protein YbhN (UPF0104 family)